MSSTTKKRQVKGRTIAEPGCVKRKRPSRTGGTSSTSIRASPVTLRASMRTRRMRRQRIIASEAREERQDQGTTQASDTVLGAIRTDDTPRDDSPLPQGSDSWASDSETLVSEGDADDARDQLSSETPVGDSRASSDYSLRFRVNDFRPMHGGVYAAPHASSRYGPRVSEETDIKSALREAIRKTIDDAQTRSVSNMSSLTPVLDVVFSKLSSGCYTGSSAPRVFAYALSGHYSVKRLIGSCLNESDTHVLHALRSAEKYGYRVCLAQLEFSHFGNPSKRRWASSAAQGEEVETFADVRAKQGRIYSIREPHGQRVFVAGSAMSVTDESVLNSDVFWDTSTDQVISHFETARGLGAYYDIEHRFQRTAIVLWRNSSQGSVMLQNMGVEDIVKRLALIDALSTDAICQLDEDLIDPILEDGIIALEEPPAEWRHLRCKHHGRAYLAGVLHRIAHARRLGDLVARIVHAQSDLD